MMSAIALFTLLKHFSRLLSKVNQLLNCTLIANAEEFSLNHLGCTRLPFTAPSVWYGQVQLMFLCGSKSQKLNVKS